MATYDIPKTMRANVLLGQQKMQMEERPVPTPSAGQLLIKVLSVGVCGSDVHYYKTGECAGFQVEEPLILGHEASGVVVAAGSPEDGNRVGERVSIDPQVPCRKCRYCKTGHLNLCPQMQFYATPPVDGTFCDYVLAPADFAFTVPDQMSNNAAALLEPFNVGVWANMEAHTTLGSRVYITGAGPIGTLTALAAKSFGASEIIVSEPNPTRREMILKRGATKVVDPTEDGFTTDGIEADVFIECTGVTDAIQSGLYALAPAGTCVFVGMGSNIVPLDIARISVRELIVTGLFRYVHTWPKSIAAASQPFVNLDELVTAEFTLEEAEEALTSTGDPTSLKSVVVVNKE